MGRATQGVRLINLEKRNDEIASVCKVLSETEEEEAVVEATEEMNAAETLNASAIDESKIIDSEIDDTEVEEESEESEETEE